MLTQDLRHACRGLRQTPMVTTAAVLTLVLGVGASTAVFSVVHAVLLRPLPYPESERLVGLFEENLKARSMFRVSTLNYLSWAGRARSFEAVGAFQGAGVTLTGNGHPELLSGSLVTAAYFPVLGIRPIAGRTLQPEDEQRGSPPVVVLGELLWRSRFGGDRQIVGRSVTLNGERYQIVGVMPRAFREVGRMQISAAADAQIFLPMRIDPAQENRGNHTLRVVGRLRRGVSLEQCREEMRAVAAALEKEFPATKADWGVRIVTLPDAMLDPKVQRSLLLVLGAVTMVFLIACANVANLLLARGARRHAELVLRTALGAGRSRLVRQLLTESGLLALISGAAGVVAAAVTQPLLRPLLPPTFPRLDEIDVDANVVLFGVLISTLSGLVFGVVPALRASRLDLSLSLANFGRATIDSSRVHLRQMLIVGEIALATMLLIAAGLLLQGFVRLQRIPLGFEPQGVLTARVSLPPAAYPDAVRVGRFFDGLIITLEGSGQLSGVAVATSAPFAPGVRATFPLPHRPPRADGGSDLENAAEHIVSGDYFQVLRVPLLAGRSFNKQDDTRSTGVAVVSQRLARMLWPDNSPLGQTLERARRPYEVVGVVGDIRGLDTEGSRGGGPDRQPRAAVYFAASQLPQRTTTVVVRPAAELTNVTASIREAVRELDGTLAVEQPRPLPEWLAESVASTRLTTTLAAMFAVCALLLTSVGIYGVLASMVSSRTREIGVRMAMGATRHNVVQLVLRDGMTWAGTGILLGLMGGVIAVRLIAALLYDVPERNPATCASVAAAVAFVSLIACLIPAARAVRIDPTIAMRSE